MKSYLFKELYLNLEFYMEEGGEGVSGVVSYPDPIFTAADGVDILLQNQDGTGVLEYIIVGQLVTQIDYSCTLGVGRTLLDPNDPSFIRALL